MREVDLQSKILEWVKEEGGYGRKLSNRFLVGIPDLLIRIMPARSARGVLLVAEVKLHTRDFVLGPNDAEVKTGVTPKQHQELSRFEHSVVIVGFKNKKGKLHSVQICDARYPHLKADPEFVIPVENNRLTRRMTPLILEKTYG
jgi:hypothetical protein